MGKNFPVTYKFDNSKSMGSTIHNCADQALKKEEYMSFIEFENESNDPEQTPLQMVWEKIVDKMQSKLSSEDDGCIFRLLLPDFNLFIP